MPNNGYFNVKRDNELIAAGTHFWCEACLVAKPVDDMSRDQRYCQGCYDFLVYEASLLLEKGSTRRPYWWPSTMKESFEKEKQSVTPTADGVVSGLPRIEEGGTKRKEDKPTSHAKNNNFVPLGRPKKELPEKEILELSNQGLSARKIARQYKISRMTVNRILNGQRELM